MCRANEGLGTIQWHSFVGYGMGASGPDRSFQKTFTHEVGHILNQDHPDECDAPDWASVMVQGPDVVPHLLFPDVEFVNDTYGPRTVASKLMWGTDALSWSISGTSPPSNTSTALGRFAATNSRSGSHMFVGFVGSAWWRPFHVSRYTGSLWEHRSSVTTWNSHSHPGIASRSNTEVIMAYPAGYDLSTGTHGAFARISTDAAASWGPSGDLSFGGRETNNPGITATFDPASEKYIILWRSSAGYNGGIHGSHVLYSAVELGGAPDPAKALDWTQAADTPSIACGEPSVVGADNCAGLDKRFQLVAYRCMDTVQDRRISARRA